MDRPGRWVLLVYRLPREPSAPRLTVWRRLKRLGAAQLADGLVALPLDSRNREQLEWLAGEVLEARGTASVWVAEPTTTAQGRELAEQLQSEIAEQYRALAAQALATRAQAVGSDRRTLARLRRELDRIRRRDYFPPPERDAATAAVEKLAETIEEAAA